MQNLFVTGESAIFGAAKIGIILFLVVYLVFAATIVKQVKIMAETLTTGFETYIKFAARLHFLFALLVLILMRGNLRFET